MRRALFWIAFNVPLGKLTPWVIGLAIGRKPVRMVWSEGKWRMPATASARGADNQDAPLSPSATSVPPAKP